MAGEIVSGEADCLIRHTLAFRVAYQETDGQRRVHHANFLSYFERGRVEMLRSIGHNYKSIEASGKMLVVTEMNIRYHAPADFDDLLIVTTDVIELGKVRMRHRYRIHRGDTLLVEADSVIACLDAHGKPARLPDLSTYTQINDRNHISRNALACGSREP